MRKKRLGEVEHITKPIYSMDDARLKRVYNCMLWRCKNDKYYVDKGIKVCKQWENSYEKFRKWAVENGYEDGLTIDRINNNGNYSPKNCRWTTMETQANNKSNTIRLEYNGEMHTISEWSKITGILPATIRSRYKRGLPTPIILKCGQKDISK